MPYHHVTAMLSEAVALLNCRPAKIIVDGTIGGCGHARVICQQIAPDGLLIGIDQDHAAIAHARDALAPYQSMVRLFHGNFIHLGDYLSKLGIPAVDGILLDLGLSLHQLEASGRGFSFQKNEPLDMRMNMENETTAADLVNEISETALETIFRQYGEERWSRQISRKITQRRRSGPIATTQELVGIVSEAVPKRAQASQTIHPATRVFMALRIAVNRELDVLAEFIEKAVALLRPRGRLCVLSFHSLEDRIVKHEFRRLATACTCPPELPRCVCNGRPRIRVLTRRVRRPKADEVRRNPMARSTRLRAAEKI
jgi:16S rRNA (cytosine1402-N4)-methyltransferase